MGLKKTKAFRNGEGNLKMEINLNALTEKLKELKLVEKLNKPSIGSTLKVGDMEYVVCESKVNESLLDQLAAIDDRLSGKNEAWDADVEEAFGLAGVSNFEDLIKQDPSEAQALVRCYINRK